MKIDILSLFPEFIEAFFHQSMIKRALEGGLMEMAVTNPRDFTKSRHGQVDDEVALAQVGRDGGAVLAASSSSGF